MEEGGGIGGRHRVTSEEAKASWRETLQLHLDLREQEEEEEGEDEEGGSEVESSDVEGEYSPWEMERHSGLWLLLEEGTEEEFSPLTSQGSSSAAGSDIIYPDTPVAYGSTFNMLPTPSPEAPSPASTASFITMPDSAPNTVSPTHPTPDVVIETSLQRAIPPLDFRGQGSFRDISPELQPHKPLLLQEGGEDSEEERTGPEVGMKGRNKGVNSLPPLQGVGVAVLQLKGLREAPPLGQEEVEGGGARALWKAVFSGHRKEKKKRGKTIPLKRETASQRRAIDVRGVRTEESDLASSTLLQRCSLEPKNNLHLELTDLASEIRRVTIKEEQQQWEPAYVPHALAFKRTYATKRRSGTDRVPVQDSDGQSSCPTEVLGVLVEPKEPSSLSIKETLFQRGQEDEEDLDTKITRRVQRAARRQAKQEEMKRLHKAQMIQRQLQQVEEKQRQLEERGVMVEKALRGEADYWGESNDSQDIDVHLGGLGKLDNPALMQQWFQLVQQKNSLVRYESELMMFARELELEDRQSRLQQVLRERMAVDDRLKEEWQLAEERLILEEMLEVVEQRDALVSLLEEQRLQELQEDRDLEQVMMTRGLGLSWA